MPLKILFLSHRFYPDIGGIETIAEILAQSFVCKGNDVKLATWSIDPSEKKFGFPVYRNPNLPQLIRLHKWADVVFENNVCLRLSWPAFLLKKISVVSLQTWVSRLDGSIKLPDKLKFLWLKRAGKVIACSNAVKERCWPDAIAIGNPYRESIFRELPDIKRDKDFVFLGRLVSDKGADLAIKAISKLVVSDQYSQDNNIKLSIVGDGPERKHLEQLSTDLGLQNHVCFTGSLTGDTLVHFLNRHKYIIIPSLWEEPFGVVALEGMACGCLPVFSDGGGLKDAVGGAGISFERGNVDSLADALKEVITNTNLKTELTVAAERHLKKHSSIAVSGKYLEIFEEAMSGCNKKQLTKIIA
ncbi:glycosyltransferase family 4 protein [Danxiaibacter flavus]|uniref:Glycosyltransferase family 4 protein n=1 Tax=Danxiaibacter flavus TaxID=3049108 RepID=A0ABV3ZK57_9BACT|nr:glycosyltransferase family 4 protein [Chitinophagaceae bacterium DXS]